MTVDWSLCSYPACIEECRDAPKIDCPAVLAWREKKDDTMTDFSKEAVERLAKTADLFAKTMKAFQHHTKKHNEDVRDTLRAQAARIAELEAKNQSLEADLENLQLEYDQHQTKVSADFEGDCWVSMRGLLEITGFKDWTDPDGVTADRAYQHIKDALLAKDTSHDG